MEENPVGAELDASAETAVADAAEFGTTSQRSGTASFGKMLVESGVITDDQLTSSLRVAKQERLPLARVLERDGFVMARDLAALVALHLGLAMVELRTENIDPAAVASLPENTARRHVALPIRKNGDRVTVAMADPTDLQAIQDITVRTGGTVEPVVATAKDIIEHIDLSYRLTEMGSRGEESEGGQDGFSSGRLTASKLRDAQPAEVIDLLLRQALQDRTSDIHITPAEARLRIRFRIDGILHDVMNLPMEMHPTFISRLKIMSGMNIAERRRPQDGHFAMDLGNRNVEVRAAVSNTVQGEMAVLRLLDKQFTIMGLDQLGMRDEILEGYRSLLRLPYGIVIVCGPTGAGKSSTLYASVLQMNRMEQNVMSLEDPVEYQILDTNQMQVNPDAGVTFAGQLRSILRLDPDVILVGEIRDQETALIAIQAALTGHLVLTSLHANDSVAALVRLRDLGVAPYLLTSSVAGIVAQRMVRVICGGCQTMMSRPVEEHAEYEKVTGERRDRFVYGTGCNVCARTGYRGRTGVFELLTMTDRLRELFLNDAGREEMVKAALEDGLMPLRADAMMGVQRGITTPYEVMRVLYSLE